MDGQIIIPLNRPIPGPHGPIHRLIMREPTYDEYVQNGEPWTIAESPGGTPFMVENPDVIEAYIRCCLVEPQQLLVVKQGGYRVARALKRTVLGFFREGVEEDEGSTTSTTSSSSASEPSPQPMRIE